MHTLVLTEFEEVESDDNAGSHIEKRDSGYAFNITFDTAIKLHQLLPFILEDLTELNEKWKIQPKIDKKPHSKPQKLSLIHI